MLRKAEQGLLENTKLRMLRWMMGINIDKIRTEETITGVEKIIEKISSTAEIGHYGEKGRGRCDDENMEVCEHRKIGRPKLKCESSAKQNK